MADVTSIFNNMVFPAAAFIVCAWFLKYVYDRSLTQFDKSLTAVAELTKAVNHNTEVLAELVKEVRENDNK